MSHYEIKKIQNIIMVQLCFKTLWLVDEIHLLHLGLMKKLLNGYKTGTFGLRTKWSKLNEKEIDAYLLSSSKPFEIHRKMRGLNEIARWKATKFRTFLFYTSLPVLKKFLPPEYFQQHLLFYCAVVILRRIVRLCRQNGQIIVNSQ